jgi:predicted Zn-dependent protease
MAGGTGTTEDLIKSTKRGVLITSLWYVRSVDPKSMLFTGLTRDGVFWIENGEIVRPLTNFRWNDSPVAVLKGIEAMSESARVSPRSWRSNTVRVPALRVKEFELSSVSDAV